MKPILLVDFGSTYTKVTAVDLDSENILATARCFTTIKSGIEEGLDKAINDIGSKVGELHFDTILGCSSAAGGLKMVTVGLVPELTAEAAKRAALSAGAKVVGVYSYELSKREAKEIEGIKPDILLLTGGTDGGNSKVVLSNAKIIADINGDFPVIVACNKVIADEAADILRCGNKNVTVVNNVMPKFNVLEIEPARGAIRDTFLKRIVSAKGLSNVQKIIDDIVMPTPSAVLKALKLLAKGCDGEEGIGDLIAVDIGGATTDVYSICDGNPTKSGVIMKGLPEPYEKRTVEGDLGVRYSSRFLVEAAGIETTAALSGLSTEEIEGLLRKIEENPDVLSSSKGSQSDCNKDELENETLRAFDTALAKLATNISIRRHAGTLETAFTPMGIAYVQTGKDLSEVTKIIGTGGPIITNENAIDILKEVFVKSDTYSVLLPQKGELYIDKSYILASMGLLSEKYPKTALRIMKRELNII